MSSAAISHRVHLAEVRRDFGAAADTYDGYAGVQREVLGRAIDTLAQALPGSPLVLDAGCGTGHAELVIRQHRLPWRLLGIDAAWPMCTRARAKGMPPACADVHALPFSDRCFDAVLCSLVLQWAESRKRALAEMRRVTRHEGHAMITVFGEGTLDELAQSLAQVDGWPRVMPLPSRETLDNEAAAAGWRYVAKQSDEYRCIYASPEELMHALRAIGAGNKLAGRRRGLTVPATFERAARVYRERFAESDGIAATWRVHTLLLKNEG